MKVKKVTQRERFREKNKVLAILDDIFTSNRAKRDPSKEPKYYHIYSTWREVYENDFTERWGDGKECTLFCTSSHSCLIIEVLPQAPLFHIILLQVLEENFAQTISGLPA